MVLPSLALPTLHRTTKEICSNSGLSHSVLPVAIISLEYAHGNLRCRYHAGEGRKHKEGGASSKNTQFPAEQWVVPGGIYGSVPHTLPLPSPALSHRIAVKTPTGCAWRSPVACTARASPKPLYPHPPTHCVPKNCHRHALAAVAPFFIYMFGFSIISTGSADINPGINEACQSHSSKGGRKKLCVHSQKRSS